MKPGVPLAKALRDAALVIARVAAGRSLSEELSRAPEERGDTPRAALIDLTHGTLRRYGRVQALVRELSQRALPDAPIQALLWCALYALESGRYAAYTVVDQAVRACALLERWPAKGYVNALLRAYLRQTDSLESRIEADPEARYQHPRWWIEMLRAAYPAAWQAILEAGNTHPPMCLRVNRRRVRVSDYLASLEESGIKARALGDEAVLLERPVPVGRLPGFAAGEVSVQDAGAQRAARLLGLAAGQRVLDACAAPGGKSAHLLETADIALTALDADPARSAHIGANLKRLGLAARIASADCTRLGEWWDGAPYDRILADVPCSASGVVRRHPDLKWLRRARDVTAFAARQSQLLEALWRTLAAGGKLLYVTCSVFPAENEQVVEGFLARAPDAHRLGLPDGGAAQWLAQPEHDGFFYALIGKRA